MTDELTSDAQQEAQRRIDYMVGVLNDALGIMGECPFSDELSRISSLMMVFGQFSPGHHALMAAVAVERLSRLSVALDAVIEDVKGGEDFFIELTAGLIMTPSWAADSDRPAKIQAVAKAVFSECSKEQLALLTAIGMVRLSETGKGPME